MQESNFIRPRIAFFTFTSSARILGVAITQLGVASSLSLTDDLQPGGGRHPRVGHILGDARVVAAVLFPRLRQTIRTNASQHQRVIYNTKLRNCPKFKVISPAQL